MAVNQELLDRRAKLNEQDDEVIAMGVRCRWAMTQDLNEERVFLEVLRWMFDDDGRMLFVLKTWECLLIDVDRGQLLKKRWRRV